MPKLLVDSQKPFRSVYSIYTHEHLGCLFSAFVVQENSNGTLTYVHQKLAPENFSNFEHALDARDLELCRICNEFNQQSLIKKFVRKESELTKPSEFFQKVFKNEMKKVILNYVQVRLKKALSLLDDRLVYIMGKDGYPAWKKVEVIHDLATILFHIYINEIDAHYFPKIKLKGENLEFLHKNALLLGSEPAWMLLENKLFSFEHELDARKLEPFLKRKYISIPKASEADYFRKFVAPLIEKHEVIAHRFDIRKVETFPEIFLRVEKSQNIIYVFRPLARYGTHEIPLFSDHKVKVVLEEPIPGAYIFHKIYRNHEAESVARTALKSISGTESLDGSFYLTKEQAYQWLSENRELLKTAGIKTEQFFDGDKISNDKPVIEVTGKESGDWLDLTVMVSIGTYKFPFLSFRRHILMNIREFKLPDGSVALLPMEWFTDFRHLLEVVGSDEATFRVPRRMIPVIGPILPENQRALFGKYLESKPEPTELPKGMIASLREYQKEGFDWLWHLRKYHFGGILADDMGLGKTLQTLTLIAKSVQEAETKCPSMVVMPVSLIYNWLQEARKFTPGLKVLVYQGTGRELNYSAIRESDLVLTSYGVIRRDIEKLKDIEFDTLVLDESQFIKNNESKTAQAVRELKSAHRFSLTGTPIENTTMDLWSQMLFLNPGLLGGETFFRHFYMIPIEKEQNIEKSSKLRKVIAPFILRRTKEQVATELPPKVEQIHFCEMSEPQEKYYNEQKNAIRNLYLSERQSLGNDKSRFNLLSGLQRLRMIAIHPGITGSDISESGKYDEMLRMVDEIVAKGSKVLIFSQFVRMLAIIESSMRLKGLPYAYIDGSVEDRMGEVKKFQEERSIQVFLISLKAGGVGLNLTAAEYVFILDPWWNPAVERQAIDRAHRIGQEKTVFAYKFISRNSIEEKILVLQEKKAKLAGDLIRTGEDMLSGLTEADLESLLD